jgi:gliding motility-associated-like protein
VNGVVREPYIYDLPQGMYDIRIYDLNNCKEEASAELTDPPLLELTFDTENAYCPDKPDGLLSLNIDGGTPGYDVIWDRGLPANEMYFTEVTWGDYIATVTDANFCVTTDTVYVDYTFETCLVIPNAFSPNGDGFNDLWIIENLEFYPQVDLKIFDRWGNMVYITGNAADEPWDGTYNGRVLPIDSYHYVIDLNYGDNKPILNNVTIVR